MTNYKAPAAKASIKARALRFVGIVAMFVSFGLMMFAADQVGQHLQEHRSGFNAANR